MTNALPYTLINADSKSPFLLTAEHAGNEWPAELPAPQLPLNWQDQHYAYDRGVSGFAQALAQELGCPLLMGRYSRLLVDLNRVPGDKSIIAEESDGVAIPDNQNAAQLLDTRLPAYYQPYHRQLRQLLHNGGSPRRLVSIHSFTRQRACDVVPRPWDIGIQYTLRTPLAERFLQSFAQLDGVTLGDNQPYNLRNCGSCTMSLHLDAYGLDGAELEFCEDQLTNPTKAAFWLREVVKVLLEPLE